MDITCGYGPHIVGSIPTRPARCIKTQLFFYFKGSWVFYSGIINNVNSTNDLYSTMFYIDKNTKAI